MNNKNINNLIEYSSLMLVLTFFIFHNIYLVFLGIMISLFSINKDILNKIFTGNKVTSVITTKPAADNDSESDSISINSEKDTKVLSLVEVVEDSGFIPSIDTDNDIDIDIDVA